MTFNCDCMVEIILEREEMQQQTRFHILEFLSLEVVNHKSCSRV